jgi:hypothetical protein
MEHPFLDEHAANLEKSFKIIHGKIPILVSATQSVPQLREGVFKQESTYRCNGLTASARARAQWLLCL